MARVPTSALRILSLSGRRRRTLAGRRTGHCLAGVDSGPPRSIDSEAQDTHGQLHDAPRDDPCGTCPQHDSRRPRAGPDEKGSPGGYCSPKERALGRIDALLTANAHALPTLIEEFAASRDWINPRLRELLRQDLPPEQARRVRLALLPFDPDQAETLGPRSARLPDR